MCFFLLVYCRDFAKTQLPAIAKIVKGQHQNLGVPTLSNPSLQSTALFLNAGKKYQILAQPIKIKEGRKSTNVGKWTQIFSSKYVPKLIICVVPFKIKSWTKSADTWNVPGLLWTVEWRRPVDTMHRQCSGVVEAAKC